ncbi:transporter substrate-binding domain-containing protein [Bradyrhizobium sp. INPA01-394B]|uniref:Transporter substrate-binding domain-containing protein n=1 Tax=Bradyrhizobium campsiandrae TaxID=1729892 RepID=A0ABR7UK12_9BRAD|nr:transporter substrate-binding domain-containing protein [Bradyrhizobium campsiandrae]MBC9879145.1 transporter substrate-binding domain-containing protein [Bradyrhizobium campsiandrae]MBC9983789.1 transporter substrate-binding domain-containing protein [Bradyrhizobium campsiandrae]
MWTRREAVAGTITALATACSTQSTPQAQTLSATGALAPTGKLRVALIASNPVLVTRRPDKSLGGVSVAIGNALAAHLGVPVELKPYDNPVLYNESLAFDEWDIGLAARDPSRAEYLAFSNAFMEVDNGYVARPGAAPTTAEEVDRTGVRIAVAQGSAPNAVLKRLIKNAEIVPVPGGFEPAREALATGTADVYGENLHLAYRIADALPGARVLPGHFNVVQMAIGVRKRAAAALPTVDEFVNKIRSDGTVQKAIVEAGLRGVRVP